MHLPNLSRLELLLIGLSTLFLVTAPLNNSMFPDSPVLRTQSALWLVAASGAVVFGGKYRWLALIGTLYVTFSLLVTTYMKSFGLESITNDEKYSSVLDGESLDFGSTPWFVFGAALNLAIATIAIRLTRSGKKGSTTMRAESLPEA